MSGADILARLPRDEGGYLDIPGLACPHCNVEVWRPCLPDPMLPFPGDLVHGSGVRCTGCDGRSRFSATPDGVRLLTREEWQRVHGPVGPAVAEGGQ